MAKTVKKSARRPRILITGQDLKILESMVGNASSGAAAVMLLEAELERAVVVKDTYSAQPFCRIGSWVTYQDLTTGQVRNIQIVLPAEADIDQQKVSILSLVGASLLGLAVNAEFDWSNDSGRPHRLKVLNVGDERDAQRG
ncbi:GreA/GreB family elongation factor [uncultured Brevundimonas sp.]|uniref:GreA/GreB family elongation factor n=1 Tax=uncultured Brevundimonas sp. TaxID=213418 RepID=UPI0030EC0F96|tara:strand:+ start:469 stop:891 length:423 start_codon:yes stop_codon:yes gene_type:complete